MTRCSLFVSACGETGEAGGQRDGKKPDNKETGKHLLHILKFFCICYFYLSAPVAHDGRMPVFTQTSERTSTRWRVATTRLACCHGAHGPWHGIGSFSVTGEGPGPSPREFVFVFFCGLVVCLLHFRILRFFFCFWSDSWNFRLFWDGQLGALLHTISSAATCKLLRTG